MKNEAAVIDPINYLEMLFGRFVSDRQDLEIRRLNYFCFSEVTTSFIAIGAFETPEQCAQALHMDSRLKQVLDI